ncbi:MAG: restriction endonuclease subunit S [Paraclostridium sp.]
MGIKKMKIKEFAEVVSGSTPKTKVDEYWNGEYFWITPAEIKEGDKYINYTSRTITKEGINSCSLRELRPNTVLLSSRAPIGKVALLGNSMYCNQGFKNLICNEEIVNPEYIYYWLSSKKEYLNSLGRGATFKEISKKIVEDIEVPIQELEEQNKIVNVLNKAQELIDKRKEQIESLDELVKSRFIELFGDIKRNPYGWESFKLEDLYEIIDGDRGKNYPKQDEFYDSEYCLFLNAGNVTSKGFSFRKNAFITKEKDEVLRKGKLERKDIVVTTRGTVGNIAYYDETVQFENIRINSGMVILRQKKEINHIFFIEYFRNPIVCQSLISGSAQPQMPISSMKNANIYVPPIELQNEFAEFVRQVDKLKFEMESSLKELENNFNSLMQKSFKGESFQ